MVRKQQGDFFLVVESIYSLEEFPRVELLAAAFVKFQSPGDSK